MNNKTASALLNKRANAYFIKYDGKKSKDEKYREMLLTDADDLRIIAAWIGEGDLKTALHKAQLLDTAVREEIPAKVWKLLEADNA